jgi:PST family polysaccharide transporter
MWFSGNLGFLLDRFDDWWVGTYLGSSPLGFYSRAYEFAGYPRRVIANPLLSVFFPTFARLQDDRQRLSRAFFRMTSFMVRVGVLFTLVFIFTAPEFIVIFLGDKWMPMLVTFQLMIVYTLLDPLSMAAENLLAATGYPGIIARTRFVQVVAFIPAVALMGLSMGIEGVALAADLMILIGAFLLFHYTKNVVDYSDRALWFWPAVGLVAVAAILLALGSFWNSLPLWGALLGKATAATTLYILLLWSVERRQLLLGWRMIWSLVRPTVQTG